MKREKIKLKTVECKNCEQAFCSASYFRNLTLEEPFEAPVPLPEPPCTGWTFALTTRVKFFTVADTAIALMRHTAGVATRINRTITPAKYMLVRPYITMKIVASVKRLKQK